MTSEWLVDVTALWKDTNSGTGNCPGLEKVRAADGSEGYVVYGRALGKADRSKLRWISDDEEAVFVPANVLDRLPEG